MPVGTHYNSVHVKATAQYYSLRKLCSPGYYYQSEVTKVFTNICIIEVYYRHTLGCLLLPWVQLQVNISRAHTLYPEQQPVGLTNIFSVRKSDSRHVAQKAIHLPSHDE